MLVQKRWHAFSSELADFGYEQASLFPVSSLKRNWVHPTLFWRTLFNAYTERSPIGPATHWPPSLKYWKQAFLSSWREAFSIKQEQGHKNQNDKTDFDIYIYSVQNNSNFWSPHIVFHVLLDAETYHLWQQTAHTVPEPTHSPRKNVMTCVPNGIFSLPIEEKKKSRVWSAAPHRPHTAEWIGWGNVMLHRLQI